MPLTALAVSYGAEKGYAFDTLPARAGHAAHVPVLRHPMLVGLVLLALQGWSA